MCALMKLLVFKTARRHSFILYNNNNNMGTQNAINNCPIIINRRTAMYLNSYYKRNENYLIISFKIENNIVIKQNNRSFCIYYNIFK